MRMRRAGDFPLEKPKKQIHDLPVHVRIFQANEPHEDASSRSLLAQTGQYASRNSQVKERGRRQNDFVVFFYRERKHEKNAII